jgi:hypothetical protein
MMEFRGVRSSWLMLARNCDFSRSSSVRRSFAADSLAVPHGLPVVRVDEFGQRAASRRIPVSRGAFPIGCPPHYHGETVERSASAFAG